jgi:hypothetical protein
MRAAQQHEVVEIGRSTVAPMLDVVCVGPSGTPAPRESASPVAVKDLSPQPRRDVSRSSPDPDRHLSGFDSPLDDCVAGETPHRIFCEHHARVRFRDPAGSAQHGDVRMHHDDRLRDSLGPGGHDSHECVGKPRALRISDIVFDDDVRSGLLQRCLERSALVRRQFSVEMQGPSVLVPSHP